MDDFEHKEENQKSLIIHKIIQTVNLILKIEKELDISVQKFTKFNLIKQIGYLLLRDLTFFYPIVAVFISDRVDSLISMETILGNRVYQSYQELIRMSRHVKQMMTLKTLLLEGMSYDEKKLIKDLKVFTVDSQKNHDIELHFTNQCKSSRLSVQKLCSEDTDRNLKDLVKIISVDSDGVSKKIDEDIVDFSIHKT